MHHKDFFRIIIKLFGLYALIICLFTIVPPMLNVFFNYNMWSELIMAIGFTVIPITVFILLIFKADVIVRWLKLDKGFEDEKVNFGDLTNSNILKLACIIIGGLLIIDNIPTLLNQVFYLFKDSVQKQPANTRTFYPLGISAVKIAIGYVLIRNFEFVGKLLRTKSE